MRRLLALTALPALACLAACAPRDAGSQAATTNGVADGQADKTLADADTSSLDSEGVPDDFARTAWRIEDEDGARYTTYLDDGGTYRDVRNGDPWHAGSWEVAEGDSLCLTPDAEQDRSAAPRQCWTPQGMDGDSGMIVQASSGKRIRLQQVDYRPPEATSRPDGADPETADPA